MSNKFEMHREWNIFWVNIKGLDIEIDYGVYEKHVSAFANYYYWSEDSLIGYAEVPLIKERPIISIREATKQAVRNLFKEIEEERLVVWDSKNPNTNDAVKFAMFLPKSQEKDDEEDIPKTDD